MKCLTLKGVLVAGFTLLSLNASAAITVNRDFQSPVREVTGQIDGNEVIFQLDVFKETVIEIVNESSCVGTIAASMRAAIPTSFSNFSLDTAGASSASKALNLGKGLAYVGVDVSSGTCTTRVYNK